MAAPVLAHPPGDRKRVKVYELRNNDWFDRGTGFCVGQIVDDEPRIYVESEDQPERTLLETKVSKDDGYQKQQDTLIVWAEQPVGIEMALSFQEAEGCAAIWDFISHAQQQLLSQPAPDDALSEEATESGTNTILLPTPELGTLLEIEQIVRAAGMQPGARDALAKAVLAEDYVAKLIPLLSVAEDLESLEDLHRLCNVMKTIIMLNDTGILERIVTDELIYGVVGVLEYDPDFPRHKASHRHYLTHRSKFKEVVQIQDESVRRRIHHTYRLQYLKDVVLARILDDPTFSVLNSLIFFNQVDIVQHLQSNAAFIKELLLVFGPQEQNVQRKVDGVLFIQQCCAVAKNIQAQSRTTLYSHFVTNDVFRVISFALGHQEASVRTAGTEVLISLIDHDPAMMRSLIYNQITDRTVPLTETLIELLLVEVDYGVKSQMADAIRVLLDPNSNTSTVEAFAKASTEFTASRQRNGGNSTNPQTEMFIQHFYDQSARKLFQPLIDLQHRPSVTNLTPNEVALYVHLVELLNAFVRQHLFRSKYFILETHLASRVAQLLACPEKHLKLTALKFFRACIGMQDEFYNRRLMQNHLIAPILEVLFETMPRNNLLNSACLELFEYIKREDIKALMIHIVEEYREKLKDIIYVPTFQNMIMRYDQMQGYLRDGGLDSESGGLPGRTSGGGISDIVAGPGPGSGGELGNGMGNGRGVGGPVNGGRRWQVVREMDPAEEEYFNTSDDEDEESMEEGGSQQSMTGRSQQSIGNLPPRKSTTTTGNNNNSNRPLVDYPDEDDDDDDEDGMGEDDTSSSSSQQRQQQSQRSYINPLRQHSPRLDQHQQQQHPQLQRNQMNLGIRNTPPERVSEKRRREENDDEDELDKLSNSASKRRNSVSSVGSTISTGSGSGGSNSGGSGSGSGDVMTILQKKKKKPVVVFTLRDTKKIPGGGGDSGTGTGGGDGGGSGNRSESGTGDGDGNESGNESGNGTGNGTGSQRSSSSVRFNLI
ncbi:MAG: hypothetical protein M1823_003841 [Watsoniomyces obsoletus]|nr:MAG: hypothetical protein M1823_003841 [Watsoniomyces obsoletus]